MKKKHKVLGFMSIHYGTEYLRESLLSVIDNVDIMVVAHTKKPSHGYEGTVDCPETEDEIFNICLEVAGSKLIWDSQEMYASESRHREFRYRFSDTFDLILTIDADEVFKSDEIPKALDYAFKNKERYYGIDGYLNFWRSFNYVCKDGFRPIRIENLNAKNQLQNINCPLTVYHFSTCQSEKIMRYKYKIFGHASEIKKGWLDDVHYTWTPENNLQDLHPVSIGLWNAVPFDKNTLPEYLWKHDNFNKYLV